MMSRINADELANDVQGAEALVDKHQEYKVEKQTQVHSKDFLQEM